MSSPKQIYARPSLCCGCRNCANACALVHRGEVNPRLGAIKIRQDLVERYEFQELCRHCNDAPCIDACMVGCIVKDPATGIVTNDPARCVGCWMCFMVCPFGGISRDLAGQVAFKCDQCRDREQPACVEVCPTGALVWTQREDAPEEVFFSEPTVAS